MALTKDQLDEALSKLSEAVRPLPRQPSEKGFSKMALTKDHLDEALDALTASPDSRTQVRKLLASYDQQNSQANEDDNMPPQEVRNNMSGYDLIGMGVKQSSASAANRGNGGRSPLNGAA
jgi:hypothetical protein